MNIHMRNHIRDGMALAPQLSGIARDILAQAEVLDAAQRRLIVGLLRQSANRSAWADAIADGSGREPRSRTPDGTAVGQRRALFASSEWRRHYQPGLEAHVYVLGCPGLQALAMTLGKPLFKVGTALLGRLDKRVAQLNRQAYGNLFCHRGRFVAEEGFDYWSAPPLLQLGSPLPLGPVRASQSSLIVTLPAGVPHGVFEGDLNRALRPITLAAFADCDIGRSWCTTRDVDPLRLVRYSDAGARGDAESAREICILRPQTDGPALAKALEDLVIRYVGLGA